MDSTRFTTYSSFLVLKLKAIMMMVEINMSKIMLIDLSTDTFIILMIFHILHDRASYKEGFIYWILDLEDYFGYTKIPKYFKVQLVSIMFANNATDW